MTRTIAPLTNGTNQGGEATLRDQDLALPQPSNQMDQSIPMSFTSRELQIFQHGVAVGATAPSNININVSGPYLNGGNYVVGNYLNGDRITHNTTNSSSTSNNSIASGSNAANQSQHDIVDSSENVKTIIEMLKQQRGEIVKEVVKEVGKEVDKKIDRFTESIQKLLREPNTAFEYIIREVLSEFKQDNLNSVPKKFGGQFDSGDVTAAPQLKRSSPPIAVPSQTEECKATTLKRTFENNNPAQIVDRILKLLKKEGVKSCDKIELVKGIWNRMESVATELEMEETKVPRLTESDLKQLVKENPYKNLCNLLRNKLHKHKGCNVCITHSDLDVPSVDLVDHEPVLLHQPRPFDFQQYLGLKYVIDGQEKEVLFQFDAFSQEDCQPSVDFVVREVAFDDDLIMCTISGSRDNVCAISANVLKDVASKEGCILHFDRCKLDAAQASALSGGKSYQALEACPIDHLLDHLCCDVPAPGSGLKVVFSKNCPKLSALSELVKKRRCEAVMFKGIDLFRVYEKHNSKKAKEELVVLVAAELKQFVDSALLVGCDICFSETKFEGKSAVENGAIKGIICSSVLVDDNISIDHIRSMGSKLKESVCLSPSFGASMVDNNENLSSTSNVVDQIPFEEGSRRLKRCKVSSEATE